MKNHNRLESGNVLETTLKEKFTDFVTLRGKQYCKKVFQKSFHCCLEIDVNGVAFSVFGILNKLYLNKMITLVCSSNLKL